MNEDLKWLAENVHEWKHNSCDLVRRSGMTAFYCGGPRCSIYSRDVYYTRAQWQAARDELSGKPSWSDAPEDAEVVFQNADGRWMWAYGKQNEIRDSYFFFDYHIQTDCYGKVLGDWRNTLERRPEHSMSQCPADQHEFIVEHVGISNKLTSEDIKKLMNERKQWRGHEDGLPPIGMKLLNWANEKRTVIAHDNGNIVCRVEESDGSYKGYTPEEIKRDLKPLPTEEDKAVEEMMNIWGEHIGESFERVMRELYRAGFRKQESD